MKDIKSILGTGSIAGFVSALCCVTPLVLVLLGVSGVSGAMGLAGVLQQNFRWTVFIPLGVLFLASGIYLHIRRKEGTCTIRDMQHYRWYILGTVLFAMMVWIVLLYVIVPAGFRLVS